MSSPSVGCGNVTQVSTVVLHRVPIVSLVMSGQERLCLAQISNTLLKGYSYNEIHNRRVALGITCVQCTPVQLEILRRAGAMPVSSRRCGMITRREAERLVKSFLEDTAPPKLPDDFAFDVEHSCGWGCRGAFVPSRYNSSRAKCIRCRFCDSYFSPNKFIFHYHRTPVESGTSAVTVTAVYNHPDAANFNSWRRHLKLVPGSVYSDALLHAWEDVKAMFNGGNRRRVQPAQSSHLLHHTTSSASQVKNSTEVEHHDPQHPHPHHHNHHRHAHHHPHHHNHHRHAHHHSHRLHQFHQQHHRSPSGSKTARPTIPYRYEGEGHKSAADNVSAAVDGHSPKHIATSGVISPLVVGRGGGGRGRCRPTDEDSHDGYGSSEHRNADVVDDVTGGSESEAIARAVTSQCLSPNGILPPFFLPLPIATSVSMGYRNILVMDDKSSVLPSSSSSSSSVEVVPTATAVRQHFPAIFPMPPSFLFSPPSNIPLGVTTVSSQSAFGPVTSSRAPGALSALIRPEPVVASPIPVCRPRQPTGKSAVSTTNRRDDRYAVIGRDEDKQTDDYNDSKMIRKSSLLPPHQVVALRSDDENPDEEDLDEVSRCSDTSSCCIDVDTVDDDDATTMKGGAAASSPPRQQGFKSTDMASHSNEFSASRAGHGDDELSAEPNEAKNNLEKLLEFEMHARKVLEINYQQLKDRLAAEADYERRQRKELERQLQLVKGSMFLELDQERKSRVFHERQFNGAHYNLGALQPYGGSIYASAWTQLALPYDNSSDVQPRRINGVVTDESPFHK